MREWMREGLRRIGRFADAGHNGGRCLRHHVPVLTGGVGKDASRIFYSVDFIPTMPPDTKLTPISRTVGDEQLVDEMIFSFTHTQEMPWMLPGVPPTNRHVEVGVGRDRHCCNFQAEVHERHDGGVASGCNLEQPSDEMELASRDKSAPPQYRPTI
jgi:hypothetical protein